jgi:alpha-tubulin suppressor-like RCC1 family protein
MGQSAFEKKIIKPVTTVQMMEVPAGVTEIEIGGKVIRSSMITCGAAHTLCLMEDGSVFAWGLGTSGQLGDLTIVSKSVPTLVNLVGLANLGGFQGNSATRIKQVNACRTINASFALAEDGSLYSWGANTNGQLGIGNVTLQSIPQLVSRTRKFKKVVCGTDAVYAIGAGNDDGVLFAWGANDKGQLGDGTVVPKSTPTIVSAPGIIWKDIDAGAKWAAAINDEYMDLSFNLVPAGKVFTWGDNGNYQLGDGTNVAKSTPVLISQPGTTIGSVPVYQVACAANTGFAVIDLRDVLELADPDYVRDPNGYDLQNMIVIWGTNSDGLFGEWNFNMAATHPTPNFVIPQGSEPWIIDYPGVKRIKAAPNNVMLSESNGQRVWAWGNNTNGQLGIGSTVHQSSPYLIVNTFSFDGAYVSFDPGPHHAAIMGDGVVRSAGLGTSGQLGDATVVSKSIPTATAGLSINPSMSENKRLTTNKINVKPGQTIYFAKCVGGFICYSQGGDIVRVSTSNDELELRYARS